MPSMPQTPVYLDPGSLQFSEKDRDRFKSIWQSAADRVLFERFKLTWQQILYTQLRDCDVEQVVMVRGLLDMLDVLYAAFDQIGGVESETDNDDSLAPQVRPTI